MDTVDQDQNKLVLISGRKEASVEASWSQVQETQKEAVPHMSRSVEVLARAVDADSPH